MGKYSILDANIFDFGGAFAVSYSLLGNKNAQKLNKFLRTV